MISVSQATGLTPSFLAVTPGAVEGGGQFFSTLTASLSSTALQSVPSTGVTPDVAARQIVLPDAADAALALAETLQPSQALTAVSYADPAVAVPNKAETRAVAQTVTEQVPVARPARDVFIAKAPLRAPAEEPALSVVAKPEKGLTPIVVAPTTKPVAPAFSPKPVVEGPAVTAAALPSNTFVAQVPVAQSEPGVRAAPVVERHTLAEHNRHADSRRVAVPASVIRPLPTVGVAPLTLNQRPAGSEGDDLLLLQDSVAQDVLANVPDRSNIVPKPASVDLAAELAVPPAQPSLPRPQAPKAVTPSAELATYLPKAPSQTVPSEDAAPPAVDAPAIPLVATLTAPTFVASPSPAVEVDLAPEQHNQKPRDAQPVKSAIGTDLRDHDQKIVVAIPSVLPVQPAQDLRPTAARPADAADEVERVDAGVLAGPVASDIIIPTPVIAPYAPPAPESEPASRTIGNSNGETIRHTASPVALPINTERQPLPDSKASAAARPYPAATPDVTQRGNESTDTRAAEPRLAPQATENPPILSAAKPVLERGDLALNRRPVLDTGLGYVADLPAGNSQTPRQAPGDKDGLSESLHAPVPAPTVVAAAVSDAGPDLPESATADSRQPTAELPVAALLPQSDPEAEPRTEGEDRPVELVNNQTEDTGPAFVLTRDTVPSQPKVELATAPQAPVQPSGAERHLDLARQELWLDELARDIVAARQDANSLSFRLSPERLGRLDVEVLRSDAGMSVNMTASSAEASAAIAAAQPKLVEELKSQGARVVETQVRTSDGASTGGNPQSQRQGQDTEYAPFLRTVAAETAPDQADEATHESDRFA